MFIVLGATGHVGSATARALLGEGEPVTVVTREAAAAEDLRALGATVAVADVRQVDALRDVFRRGKRLFLLNPPAAPSTDTDVVERETIRCILDALDGSKLEKVVAESTYGAQPGGRCGDLNTLFELEEGLRAQPIPTAIIRAAYYFSNWDPMLKPAGDDGVLPTMYPVDLKIPMVAPDDLGRVAAHLLKEPADRVGVHYVEGPERYSSGDVAATFAKALGREVRPVATPRDQWEQAYRDRGFSEAAAHSYARMTAVSVDGDYDMPDAPICGSITLESYIGALVQKAD